MRRRFVAAVVITVFAVVPLLAGLDGKKALYVGGTVPGLTDNVEGRFDTTSADRLAFTPDKKDLAAIAIPYKAITELEYGQKAGRRVGVAVMVSPLALFSKKRKHYLTISYKDDAGKDQAGVFELGKDIIRTTVKIVETRSGQQLKFQDDEAKKSLGGGREN
jgi:hypothetical protein